MELIEVLLKLILVVFLVFMNGFFVAAEFALVKIRSSRLETLLQEGNTRAKYAKKLTDHLDASLSVTQLGITLASLGLGWVGEPAVAALLVPVVQFFGFGEDFAHSIALVVGFSLITAMHIILGELAPKSMAIQKAETVTLNISIPMLIFHKIMWPAVWILNHVANWVIIRLGFEVASEGEEAHSEEEIRLLMDGRLRWQGQEWCIVKAPWMIKSGMMLRLRSDGGKRQHLWLAADSMDEAEWRDLRRILLQQETQR